MDSVEKRTRSLKLTIETALAVANALEAYGLANRAQKVRENAAIYQEELRKLQNSL